MPSGSPTDSPPGRVLTVSDGAHVSAPAAIPDAMAERLRAPSVFGAQPTSGRLEQREARLSPQIEGPMSGHSCGATC